MNPSNKISVLITDNHEMFADGIKAIVNQHAAFQVAGFAANGKKMLHALNTYPVDLVLLDLNMPELSGFEAAEIIKRRFPSIKIIVISMYNDAKILERVKALGVEGFLSKDLDAAELISSMEKVMAGEKVFPENNKGSEKEVLASDFTDSFMEKYSLTPREAEIVKLIVEELSTKTIAEKLHISELTVDSHRKNICRKLHVSSTLAIYKLAVKNGL